MILLLGGSFPYFTSFRYFTIPFIFPSNPCRAWTFSRILLESEFREIYLIYLNKCSTPISYGSVAYTFESMWKNDFVIDPVLGLTYYLVMKAWVGRPS